MTRSREAGEETGDVRGERSGRNGPPHSLRSFVCPYRSHLATLVGLLPPLVTLPSGEARPLRGERNE